MVKRIRTTLSAPAKGSKWAHKERFVQIEDIGDGLLLVVAEEPDPGEPDACVARKIYLDLGPPIDFEFKWIEAFPCASMEEGFERGRILAEKHRNG